MKANVTRRASSTVLLGVLLALGGGCSSVTSACADRVGTVIRLRVKDGKTGASLGSTTVSAQIVGAPASVIFVAPSPDDSTITQIKGDGGLYELTVKKSGYADATQRVSIPPPDGCSTQTPLDITVTLQPLP